MNKEDTSMKLSRADWEKIYNRKMEKLHEKIKKDHEEFREDTHIINQATCVSLLAFYIEEKFLTELNTIILQAMYESTYEGVDETD